MRIDGQEIANEIFKKLKKRVDKLNKKNIFPHLSIILVGEDEASKAYVRQKELRAKDLGIKTTIYHLNSSVSSSEILKLLKELNNQNTQGIIVQRPLPRHINPKDINSAIEPKKDVDAFNQKTLFSTPLALAILKILEKMFIKSRPAKKSLIEWLKSKKIVVIGKGETGGSPIKKMLKSLKIQPSIIDSKTESPEKLARSADIIISAVGKSNVIKPGMLKKGVILIGVGLHKKKNKTLGGDYKEEQIKNIASFYTPSPGGVGPVNVAMLLENVVKAAEGTMI